MTRRVAVTGIGIVSPLGSDLDGFRNRLLEGAAAGGPITIFDPAELPTRIAAEADSGALPGMTRDRKIAFGAAAARAAVEDAGARGVPPARRYPPGSGGLSLGIGLELFSMPDLVRLLESGVEPGDGGELPLEFLQTPSDICLHRIAAEHRLETPPLTHISACAASTDALGCAFEMVRDGERAWMLAGGTDSMINPMGVAGFSKIQAMTRRNGDPRRASRPFDRGRDGFLLGEGAGILVLEPLDEARARGARIRGEVAGYGNSFDAHGISEPHPEGEGALLSMRRALANAGIGPGDVRHINAHGTSTPKNDPVEALAIRRLLGAGASSVPVSSTKSMIGHLISASGAVEAAAMLICAAAGWIHPTANLEDPDPLCDLDHVRAAPRRARPGWYLKNSFGFGGQNASLVFRVEG